MDAPTDRACYCGHDDDAHDGRPYCYECDPPRASHRFMPTD